ncbi:MAG: YgjP-like metallopeptidase domain-containing protein [Bacilli bacterium]|nr:YgjP-like metallopeptidase domain-containing protein [Bacilli bacterium]
MEIMLNGYRFQVDIIYDNYHRIRCDFIDKRFVVKAYHSVKEVEIIDFLKKREKKLYQMALIGLKKEQLKDKIDILGKTYHLKSSNINCISNDIIYCNDLSNIINICISLFYQEFYNYLAKKTTEYYHLMYKENNLPTISVTNVKGYYGQYNKRNNHIKYNICLLFSPYEVINAIIVHELAHIKYMNHQKEFYDFVTLVLPNYKFLHNKLKKEGMKL